jgi:Rrf2 family protein
MNKKFNLALSVLGAISQCSPNRPVTAVQIAQTLGLSVSYIEALVRTLRVAGYVVSVRGPGGGYLPGALLSIATAGDVYKLFSEDDQAREDAIEPKSSAHASVQEIAVQMQAIEQAFLENYALVNITSRAPKPIQTDTFAPHGFKFKPVTPSLRPDAPNSIFDVARYRQSKAKAVYL